MLEIGIEQLQFRFAAQACVDLAAHRDQRAGAAGRHVHSPQQFLPGRIGGLRERGRGFSRGIGNFLIKQVVEDLHAEFPQLKRFSTLSPVPGFRRWLTQQLAEESNPDAALLPKLARAGWWHDPEQSEPLRAALMRLCATYLTRRPSPGNRIDPVARFHLGNGARLEPINWLGNTELRAIQQSFGILVNYLYHHANTHNNPNASR